MDKKVVVIGVLVTVIILSSFSSDLFSIGGNAGEGTLPQEGDFPEPDEPGQGGLSYPDIEYLFIADRLEGAMQDAFTDDETVFEMYGLLNTNADHNKLLQAFGVRDYQGSIIWSPFPPSYNLPQFIRAELDSVEIDDLNSLLFSKGINFRY